MPVRNTEQMMFNSIHNVDMSSKMSYLLFMFISSPCQNREMFIARIAEIMLGIKVLARIAECLEIKRLTVLCETKRNEMVLCETVLCEMVLCETVLCETVLCEMVLCEIVLCEMINCKIYC